MGGWGEGGAKGWEPPPSCPHTPAGAPGFTSARPSMPPMGSPPFLPGPPGMVPTPLSMGPLLPEVPAHLQALWTWPDTSSQSWALLYPSLRGSGGQGALCEVALTLTQGPLRDTRRQGHQELRPMQRAQRGTGATGGSQCLVSSPVSLSPQPGQCPALSQALPTSGCRSVAPKLDRAALGGGQPVVREPGPAGAGRDTVTALAPPSDLATASCLPDTITPPPWSACTA